MCDFFSADGDWGRACLLSLVCSFFAVFCFFFFAFFFFVFFE